MLDPAVPSRFKVPKRPSKTLSRNETQKCMRMSLETYDDDGGGNHDYPKENVNINYLVIPSSNIDNHGGNANSDAGEDNVTPLHVQIGELEGGDPNCKMCSFT